MNTKKLISMITDSAKSSFGAYGFKKRSGQIFTQKISDETIGWLGLNRAVLISDKLIEINPVIGVRHQPTEKLLAEVLEEKFHPYIPPTVSIHLGYVTPKMDYTPWFFPINKNPSKQIDILAEAIKSYGLPFMHSNKELKTLTLATENQGLGILEQTKYRLPVMHYLLGNKEYANIIINKELKNKEKRKDLAAQYYRKFAKSFKNLLGTKS